MKFIIASDIHGSKYYAEKIIQIKEKERADKIILLGDIFNHGPRNPLPKEYAPLGVAEILNGIKKDLIVIKGNCDSQVDTIISQFDFLDNLAIVSADKSVFLTHGHVYNKDCPPKTNFDVVIYGHFHTGFIEKIGDTIFANAGSVSLPKNDTPSSYILLDDGVITLKDIDGKIIKELKI